MIPDKDATSIARICFVMGFGFGWIGGLAFAWWVWVL